MSERENNDWTLTSFLFAFMLALLDMFTKRPVGLQTLMILKGYEPGRAAIIQLAKACIAEKEGEG